MNQKKQTDTDTELRALLREWKVVATLPPRFQEQVWRSIERQDERSPVSVSLRKLITNWISTVLPRPALAVSYVTILLAVGASVGWTQARQDKTRMSNEMSHRYVQSVDPYQGTR